MDAHETMTPADPARVEEEGPVFDDALGPILTSGWFWEELRGRYHLTGRQVQYLQGVCRGQGTKEIARSWRRVPKTVEAVRCKIYAKLDVDSLGAIVRRVCAAAVSAAVRRGVLVGVPPCADCPLRRAAEQVIGGRT
jgi:DNA-binding CsgD family transcriptional regulator